MFPWKKMDTFYEFSGEISARTNPKENIEAKSPSKS